MYDKISAVIYLFFFALERGVQALKVSSPQDINASLGSDSTIVLNCSFEIESKEIVESITWSKKERIARYEKDRVLYYDTDLKARSNSITFGNGSTSAILNITEIQCKDDGQYDCTVEYRNNSGDVLKTISTNTTVYILVTAKMPMEFSLQPANISLEENTTVNMSCLANVGKPGGMVTIWKQSNLSDVQFELGKSSSNVDYRNCSVFANLIIPYKLTRSDNGFTFGCTSKNRHTQDPALSIKRVPRNILYGPSTISVEVQPNQSYYNVKDNINLTCISNGNPRPTFKWKFNSTDIMENIKYTFHNGNATVIFTFQYLNESGNYQCYVENYVNEKFMNKTDAVLLIVKEQSTTPKPMATESCFVDTCSFMEKCYENDDTAICSVDVWKIVSFVFIALSLILGVATLSLCLLLRIRKRRIGYINDGLKMSNNKFEDFGGYADPKDVKRPFTHVVEENGGRDNPYADPLDMKPLSSSVQKSTSSPLDSSRPKSLSSTTNPESLLNPQGLENISSNTDSSNPGSDNIQKPPNVYDDAWV